MHFPFVKRIMTRISKSTAGENNISSTRIQSYIILLPILIMTAIFLVIELWQFIHTIYNNKDYAISTEIIVIFGMLLSHHLAVMFSRKQSQSIEDITGNNNSLDKTKKLDKVAVDNTEDDMNEIID